MRRRVLTQQTVRCPLEDETASLTVRTDPEGKPSRRHRDVMACSLIPAAPFVPPATRGYFSDFAPPACYVRAFDPAPRHASAVGCSKRCLAVLNAAEGGGAEVSCMSGVSDALDLARQVQTPAMMRVLWMYSV